MSYPKIAKHLFSCDVKYKNPITNSLKQGSASSIVGSCVKVTGDQTHTSQILTLCEVCYFRGQFLLELPPPPPPPPPPPSLPVGKQAQASKGQISLTIFQAVTSLVEGYILIIRVYLSVWLPVSVSHCLPSLLAVLLKDSPCVRVIPYMLQWQWSCTPQGFPMCEGHSLHATVAVKSQWQFTIHIPFMHGQHSSRIIVNCCAGNFVTYVFQTDF